MFLVLPLLVARMTRGSKVGSCCDRGSPQFVIGDDEEADAEERVNERAVDLVGDRPGMPIPKLRLALVLALLPGMAHGAVVLRGGGRREGGGEIWSLRLESLDIVAAEPPSHVTRLYLPVTLNASRHTRSSTTIWFSSIPSSLSHNTNQPMQDPSLRIVPANGPKSTSLNKDTTNSFGLHDTLQYGARSIAQEVKQDGVIRQRLESVSPRPLPLLAGRC